MLSRDFPLSEVGMLNKTRFYYDNDGLSIILVIPVPSNPCEPNK
jgi:hypothetical protein